MERKLIIITGHFGSGKTELAMFYASKIVKTSKRPVALCDLDVINPYFRSRDYGKELSVEGVRLIAPKGELLKADLPIVTGEVAGVIENDHSHVIIDVGGDKDGALSLGQFSHLIKNRPYEFWFVLNANRPYVSTKLGIINTINEIENASRLKVTGIINNTHLGEDDYGPEEVVKGESLALQASMDLGIPFLFSLISNEVRKRWGRNEYTTSFKDVEYFDRKLLAPWSK
ncbi:MULTISPECIES: ATP-binding protein [Bacillaceae]|uniref:ATP-binding protein n=1 Tax=Evansella alkalicola TaxID=745819 RepID=A0ABS6JZH1_9BACI|nr:MULTISPECIES: ATP-binding protein [Bacillaceae]MBU9723988.1 hypothetical protein [Bacillus alkalicola]